MPVIPSKPLPSFLFGFKITSGDLASSDWMTFKSVTGLTSDTEVTDFEEGGVRKFTRKLIGVRKWGPLVLENGFTGDMKLFQWMFSPTRVNGVIVQLAVRPEGGDFKEVCRWEFTNGVPTVWEGPGLDANKNEIAVEKLTIVHEGLKFINGEPPPPPPPTPEPPPPPPAPISANVQFASNSSTVPSPNAGLDAAAEELKKDPDRKVKVEGHTDSEGSEASNQALSERRANATRDYLINKGAKPEQVTATGYGESQPIADNATAAGRAQNRRCIVEDA